jgi:phenylalanyl-tRNA synthetase beta chain
MKLSLNLLSKYFDFAKQYTPNEISEIITNLGFEVEEMEDLSSQYQNFIIAQILEVKSHPSSTKTQLNLCKVDTGTEVLDIVCGAQNVRPNLKIILAKVGAIVPYNKMEIKKSLIRGEKSEGMICSASELLLNNKDGGDGIMELSSSAIVGTSLSDYLGGSDCILSLSITPNRGDGASIKGIVRDLEAKKIGISKPFFKKFKGSQNNLENIIIEDEIKNSFGQINFAKACIESNQYDFTNIDLYDKIWGSSNLFPVDISNLIMFATGAPNHIYDASKIEGKIYIERTKGGELFCPIKGDEVSLPQGLIVVKDDAKILSLLGVMGDARSKVTEETKEVIVEALHVAPEEVIKSSKLTGIKSDSSYRFERGVDFSIQNKVVETILASLGVKSCSLFSLNGSIKNQQITINENDYKNLIGTAQPLNSMKSILESLEFKVDQEGENLICTFPPCKYEIKNKEGVCGEVARILGFEKISPTPIQNLKPIQNTNLAFEIKKILYRSMREVITYSFFKDEYFEITAEQEPKISLQNPITKDLLKTLQIMKKEVILITKFLKLELYF